jgi:hypothetical protein
VDSSPVVFGQEQGIIVGTSYTFSVTATNDIGGTSQPGTSASVTSSSLPLAVTGLSAVSTVRGSVEVTWTCDSACAQGSELTKFVVTIDPQVAGTPLAVPATVGRTNYSTPINGLADETNYTVSVVAYNGWGIPGQSATYPVLTKGQPSATVMPSWNGLELTLSIAIVTNGATVTGCQVSLSGPGGTIGQSSSSGCPSLTMSAPYYDGDYMGTLVVTSAEFGNTNAAAVNTTSPYDSLDANAEPAFPCPGTDCGPQFNPCPTPNWSASNCDPNTFNQMTVLAACWTTGGVDDGTPGAGRPTSTIWIDVQPTGGDFASYPYMNGLWFSPYYTTAPPNLQQC